MVNKAKRVFAITAHADDIEFMMAGTLILLKDAGCEIHTMNMADGSCGSVEQGPEAIAAIRLKEAEKAAWHLEAVLHPPLCRDMEIFYNNELLKKMGSIMRDVAPDILLLHSPQDYMEDHMNACRVALTAAFSRGMKNYTVDPPVNRVNNDITIYHAQPHGNRDPLNRLMKPDIFVDITSVIERKADMLAEHRSQKEWLDYSQGMDAYVNTMKELGREMGSLSEKFEFAEGWRRHNPLGFCAADANPLVELLSEYVGGVRK